MKSKITTLLALAVLLTQTGCLPVIGPAIGQFLLQLQVLLYGPFREVPNWLHKLFLLFE